jgi:hypothetical protein
MSLVGSRGSIERSTNGRAPRRCIAIGHSAGVLPDGRPFVDVKIALTKAVSYLPPGETTRMAIEAREGSILGTSPEGKASLLFSIEGAPAATDQVAQVLYEKQVREHAPGSVAPGAITFEVKNATAERGTFFLAVLPPGTKVGQAPITFLPFLTGKRLLTTQTFRDLFRSEVIRASEGMKVRAEKSRPPSKERQAGRHS